MEKLKRTFTQLIKEFWLQFFVSLCWAIYQTAHTSSEPISVFISNFSVSFFLTSWLMGQVVRVRRQQRVEDQLQKLLGSLEQQTQHLIGYTTGGDSVGYFEPSLLVGHQRISFDFFNLSKYPVFDVYAEWVDLDEPIDIPNKKFWTRHTLRLGAVYPNKAAMNVFGFDMAQRTGLRINIFVFMRNGGLTQQIRVERAGDKWVFATKTQSEQLNETKVSADFPGYDPQNPDAVFK